MHQLSPAPPPRPFCPQGAHCLKVRTGQCSYWHQFCPDGHYCMAVRKLDCAYYHPKNMYPNPMNQRLNQNRNRTTHRFPVKRPANDNRPWTSEQDKTLWRWMRNTNVTLHKSLANLAYLAKKNKRTHSAIRIRMDKLNKLYRTAQSKPSNVNKIRLKQSNKCSNNLKTAPKSPTHNNTHVRTLHPAHTGKVNSVLNDLRRYYKKENNLYELGNINALQTRMNKANWNGDMKRFEEIAGVGFQHFEKQLSIFHDKYGKIDTETTQKTIHTLKQLRKAYQNEIESIDRVLQDIKERDWFGDAHTFNQITGGHDIRYFEHKLNELQGLQPKVEVMDSDSHSNNSNNVPALIRVRHRSNSIDNEDDGHVAKRRKLNPYFAI
eukprot:242310_1